MKRKDYSLGLIALGVTKMRYKSIEAYNNLGRNLHFLRKKKENQNLLYLIQYQINNQKK